MDLKDLERVNLLAKRRRNLRNSLLGQNAHGSYYVCTTPCFGETVYAPFPAEIARPHLFAELARVEAELLGLGLKVELTPET